MRRVACSVAIGTVLVVLAGCNRNSGPDPSNANLAPVDQNAYPQQEPYGAAPAGEELAEAPAPPPPLPDYRQPPCPGENYIWTPGYWAYEDTGYYWVPGAWVLAPYVDALWTPPYWDYDGGHYRWHHGYWGRYVGYYGGIDYGFGYTGLGYGGGYWNGPVFVYNRTVTNIDTGIIRNYYRHSVAEATPFNRISYNGPGGVVRAPLATERAATREARFGPMPVQTEHMREAASNRGQFAAFTRGRPQVGALTRPLAAPYREPAAPPAAWQRGASPARQEMPRAGERFGQGAGPGRAEGRSTPAMPPGRGEASRAEQPEARPSPFERPGRPAGERARFGGAARQEQPGAWSGGPRGEITQPAQAPPGPPARVAAPPMEHRGEAQRQAPPQQAAPEPRFGPPGRGEGRGEAPHAAPPMEHRGEAQRQAPPQQAAPEPRFGPPGSGGGRGEAPRAAPQAAAPPQAQAPHGSPPPEAQRGGRGQEGHPGNPRGERKQ